MNKYQFPLEYLAQITAHIAGYNFVILSLTPSGTDYVIDVDQKIVPEELAHLNDAYNLTEVV